MNSVGVPDYLAEIILPRSAPEAEHRSANPFASVGERAPMPGWGGMVSNEDAMSVPAINQAVRLAAQGVARLELAAYTGEGLERRRQDRGWQTLLLARPNERQSGFQFLEVIEESLTARGNAFVWKNVDRASGRVVEAWALHPDQVARSSNGWLVLAGGPYLDPAGGDGTRTLYEVPDRVVLHLRGSGGGALNMAPSPLSMFADTIGATIARTRHERRMYENGAQVQWLFAFPPDMQPEQADEFRKMWQESYAGAQNAGKIPVIGGGPEVVRIGLSQRDAQFAETANLGIEDVARIFNVTPSLLGVQRSDRPLSPEHEEDRWLRYGLGPRLSRIEAAFRSDPDWFPRPRRVYPRFDTENAVRGDIRTESEILQGEVQTGIRLVDEARAKRGLPPLPNGMGQIPQVVPVGGQANPVAGVDPAPTNQEGEDSAAQDD